MRLSFAFCFGLAVLLNVSSEGQAQEAYDVSEFTQKVQPVLAKRCFACHGPNEAEGGLRLSSRESVLAELESGARAVIPGMAADSVLLHRIRGEGDGDRMPPEGKPLTEEEV
ncbi:MAG: c-type cytochrome domain-containing protein, partial [Planctomycetota bacterium]|nr:c-type cytochrome domain-containing protein [Planctomycetota bacterium]